MNRACESAGDWILKIAVFLVCFGPKNEDADWISLLVAAVGFDFGHRQRLAGTSHGASRPRHEIPAAKIAPQERFLDAASNSPQYSRRWDSISAIGNDLLVLRTAQVGLGTKSRPLKSLHRSDFYAASNPSDLNLPIRKEVSEWIPLF